MLELVRAGTVCNWNVSFSELPWMKLQLALVLLFALAPNATLKDQYLARSSGSIVD